MSSGSASSSAVERQHDVTESIIQIVQSMKDEIDRETTRITQVADHLIGTTFPSPSASTTTAGPAYSVDNVQGCLLDLEHAIASLKLAVARLY